MSLKFNYNKDLPKVTELKAEYLKNQVIRIKNIFQPEQKSKEWYEMRNTMLTASDWGTILGENHYSTPNQVLLKKCGDDTFFTNAAMQWGNKYESVAVQIYEFRNNVEILEFGCLKHPFISFLGASPDGITKEGVMLEIKCPTSRKITGEPPSYYWCQVQGQLEVCELDRCDFLECLIKEYLNEDEYVNDNFNGDYKLNKFGNEKGLVVEYYRKNEKTFFFEYLPVCIIENDLEGYKNIYINKYFNDGNILFSSFYYWYLEEVSCVPIYRNQEWFQKSKIELEFFWNKVLKYRELGIDQLRLDIEKEKMDKKMEKEINRCKDSKKQKKIKEYINLTDIKLPETKLTETKILDTSSDSDSDDIMLNMSVSMFSD
jgi:putative phage-type endonuclease